MLKSYTFQERITVGALNEATMQDMKMRDLKMLDTKIDGIKQLLTCCEVKAVLYSMLQRAFKYYTGWAS